MKNLRGHHLFCISLYTGHGYSQAFTENMDAVIRGLKNGEKLTLCMEQDCICEACPNREAGGGCALGTEDVLCRDKAALEVLNLEVGQEITWPKMVSLMGQLNRTDFQKVCHSCRWAKEGLCSYELLCRYNAQAARELGTLKFETP